MSSYLCLVPISVTEYDITKPFIYLSNLSFAGKTESHREN